MNGMSATMRARGSRVMDHHVERNGNGVVETEHYHSDGVANEDNVNTGTIEQSRHRRIVGREDRNLRARRLHRPKIGYPNRLHGYREYRKKTKDGVICLHSVCCLSWLPSTLHGSHSIGCQTDNHNDHACNEGSHLLPPFPDVWIFGKPQPFEGIRLANQRKLTHAWKSRIWQLGAGSGSINLFGPARTCLLAQQDLENTGPPRGPKRRRCLGQRQYFRHHVGNINLSGSKQTKSWLESTAT